MGTTVDLLVKQPVGILAQSGTAVSHTGNTSETVLATVNIPAKYLAENDALRVVARWAYTNSANNKTLKIRLGGIGGTAYLARVHTTTSNWTTFALISMANAMNAQIGYDVGSGNPFSASSTASATSAIDMAAAQTLVITGQLANSGETITLENYYVEVLRAPR